MFRNKNLLLGLFGIAISSVVLYLTTSFPDSPNTSLGPSFFPVVLAYGLGFFSSLLVTTSLITNTIEKFDSFSFKIIGIRRAGFSFLITVIYCLLLEFFGFLVCTTIYLMALMFLLKERNYLLMLFSASLISSVIFLIFNILLNITLPLGLLYGY
jgi:hypothetical protein|tara:strand:+ start:75 stop:539 length:465 start_codon:yes stop_codon:yes gene_type:complete